MKKLLIIPIFLISLFCSAATYYIDPSGSDSNNGSSSSPWRTLAYACSKVTTAGDIIHVNTGTYTETTQSKLAAGVSIEGTGVNSIIKSQVGGSNPTILLSSGSEGTNGNQHISNIKMDGSALTAYAPILVWKRSNVEIYNCTFIDFSEWGVSFEGGNSGLPSTYATGNKFHDNIVTNCSNYYYPGGDGDADKTSGDGRGLLQISGQQTMLIYNNTLTQTGRPTWHNGHCIKGILGFNKDIKIYNNTLTRAAFQNETWDFAIEIWSSRGGIEVYNNVINAGVDFSGDGSSGTGISNQKGSYAYSLYIHDNIIGPAVWVSGNSRITKGIYVEQSAEGVIIERNWIKNVEIGIYCPLVAKDNGTGKAFNDVRINSNILVIKGESSENYGIYMPIYPVLTSGWVCNNVNISNNTLISTSTPSGTSYGIVLPATGTTTNISVRNNIVQGFKNAVYGQGASGVTLDILSIENNDFYNNTVTNGVSYSSLSPTHSTTQNNLTSNPLFLSSSDYHLQASSPAIAKGLLVTGVTTDYAGTVLRNPPSIGAFESSSAGVPVAPAVPVYQSSAVENAAPNLLSMTYNLALANIVPLATSFSVKVNTVARNVNAVTVSGTKVLLTLTSPVVNGDAILISYTAPATNPIQTASGGQAATLSNQTVTNNVSSVNAPVYVSAAIEDATPKSLEMTYSLSLANIVPATTAFSVLVNSVSRIVNTVAVSGTKIILTLVSPVVNGDIVTVAYTKPATSPVQIASGGQAATISSQSVTNKTISIAKDATPVTITMTISPNHVHNIISVLFGYSSSFSALNPALSPQIIRIFDKSGKLLTEQLLVTGIAKMVIPINLRRGIYSVLMLSGGLQMASQKIIVY